MQARLPEVRLLLFCALGLLVGCAESDAPDDELQPVRAPEISRIVTAEEALSGAHVPTLDPSPMNDAEIRKAIGTGPHCEFRYTSAGRPVLAVNRAPDEAQAAAIVKLNGSLVPLLKASAENADGRASTALLSAEPIQITLKLVDGEQDASRDEGRHREADMVFQVGQSLKVGYRGYLACSSQSPTKSPPQ